MSQIYKNSTGVIPPPGPVLKLKPDLGSAVVPDGSGTINLTGLPTGAGSSILDRNFETFNAGTSTMQFAFRYQGSGTTVGALPAITLITIPVTVASVMNIEVQFAGIEATPLGVGGEARGTIFRGAGAPVVLLVPDKVVRASTALSGASVDINVSGNNLVFNVTGVAGKTIEWYAIGWIVQQTFI